MSESSVLSPASLRSAPARVLVEWCRSGYPHVVEAAIRELWRREWELDDD